jgi:serine/threonine protein kinase
MDRRQMNQGKKKSQKLIRWAPGKILLDRYRICDVIGQGGMGMVYKVERISFRHEFLAVKTLQPAFLLDQYRTRMFMRELRTWIDLPDHPNLVSCRFFRTIEDQVAIFAEYVSGGSLGFWIAEKRIKDLSVILDIAIQITRGLHIAHSKNVVHQDVKPDNILMSPDGSAKMTDFGLAKVIRLHLASRAESGSISSVTTDGMTPAYCSPEQADGSRVGHWTDIWSLGLVLMEMLLGERNWQYGIFAPRAFEKVRKQKRNSGVLRIPDEIVDIIHRCTAEDPADRWKDMAVIEGELIRSFQRNTGMEYSRPNPDGKPRRRIVHGSPDFRKGFPQTYHEPREWLEKAVAATAVNKENFRYPSLNPEASTISNLLLEIEILNTAAGLYQRAIEAGRSDHRKEYNAIALQTSYLCQYASDISGGIACLDRILEGPPEPSAMEDAELFHQLIIALMNKAVLLRKSGDIGRSIELYDRAIDLVEKRPSDEAWSYESRKRLASLFLNKAVALTKIGKEAEAQELYKKAIAIREENLLEDAGNDSIAGLASVYMNLGVLYADLNRFEEADGCYDRAISLHERLVNQEGCKEFLDSLALLYTNKAVSLKKSGRIQEAFRLYDSAIDLLRSGIEEEGRFELEEKLAKVMLNKAIALQFQEDFSESLRLLNQSIELIEYAVFGDGRSDLIWDLISMLASKGETLARSTGRREALESYQTALNLLDELQEAKSGDMNAKIAERRARISSLMSALQ